MLKRTAILARGVIAVDAGTGSTYIIHSSKQAIGWWEYLYANKDILTGLVVQFGRRSETVYKYGVGMASFNEKEIREALMELWEDAPSDMTTGRYDVTTGKVVLERLLFGRFD